jgi:hypothetical protein
VLPNACGLGQRGSGLKSRDSRIELLDGPRQLFKTVAEATFIGSRCDGRPDVDPLALLAHDQPVSA